MSAPAAYRGLMHLLSPLLRGAVHRRARRGREDAARVGERFGLASQPRPAGAVVWLHAVSVGEAVAAFPLVSALLARHRVTVLFTTTTVTAARMVERELPECVIHQYLTADHPKWNQRFLAHWQPDAVIWLESDYWPDLLSRVHAAGIPAALVNGRLSQRTVRRWRLVPGLIRPAMAGFQPCLTGGPEYVARFRQLGVAAPLSLGNLKAAAAPPGCEPDSLAAFRDGVGGRFCWAAVSTHSGEEAMVGQAHQQLRRQRPDLLTVIAPRHASRGAAIAETLARQGLTVSRRSEGRIPGPDDDVHVVDTLGELGLVYRQADAAFIGGSLVPKGGHNPWEAVRFDCALLYGPHVDNAATAYRKLTQAGGARQIADAGELADAVETLQADPATARRMARSARKCLDAEGDVLARILEALEPVTAQLPLRQHGEPKGDIQRRPHAKTLSR